VSAPAPAEATPRFEHSAFFYAGDDAFLEGTTRFIRGGLAEDAAVVVAEPPARLAMLRDALGSDARGVEFLDMMAIGKNPARIIATWHGVVDATAERGRRLRGIGEPAYVGRNSDELVECKLHELLLNRAFDDGPGWRLMCPYDTTGLEDAAVSGAFRTHPVVESVDERQHSADYDADVSDIFGAPLPPPPEAAARLDYTVDDLARVRRTVTAAAREAGVRRAKADDLVVAANELAVNSITHGGGRGRLELWQEPEALLVQFSDAGRVPDPLVGRRKPTMGQEGGRGVYLVNQLCDLVQLRSTPHGTTVRVTTWL